MNFDEFPPDINVLNASDLEAWHHFLDLPVAIVIELGRTKMTLRKVLELSPQSIVRLQRSTAEGVDVVASGMHIARGEIITIEDRTGVRVTEVSSS